MLFRLRPPLFQDLALELELELETELEEEDFVSVEASCPMILPSAANNSPDVLCRELLVRRSLVE